MNGRGRRACALLSAYLAEGNVRPQAVLVSPARRTQETFAGIREALPGGFEHWTEERLYGAGTEELIGIVAELPSGLTEVMLIGHNPGLGALAAELAGSGPEAARLRHKFPTAALATLDAESEWSRLRPSTTRLRSFVRPKDLEPG